MQNNLYWEIPSSLNLKTVLKKRPPDFKYHVDKFYYILDYLSRGMDLEDLDNNEGFINLNAKKLQRAVHDYKKYLDYLLQRRIIRTDMNYVVGKKSKGYLIQGYREYRATVERVPISSWPMIKRKWKELAEIEQDNKTTEKSYPHLTKWFNDKLQIDVVSAKQRVEELFPEQTGPIRGKIKGKPSDWNRRYKAIYSIEKFARQDFYYSVDQNIGRFHSNLTNIKRELRNYIKYDNQKLVNVDIKNSQPLFSQLILSKNFYNEKSKLSIFNFPFSLQLFSPSHSLTSSIIMVVKCLENIDKQQVNKFVSIINQGSFTNKFLKSFIPETRLINKK